MAKKKSADLFGDEQVARPTNEFDALLNSSMITTRGLRPGDRFRGEVLAVSGQEAFISTGTPTDAVMPLGGGGSVPKTGDVLDVIVVRARDGDVLVKEVGTVGVSSESDSLEDAYDMEIPVEGVVTEAVKGGFRIKIQGQKAFCPISQLDWRVTQPETYIGRKYDFIITKFEGGRDIVVSRRKLLELERAAAEGEFLRTSEVGQIYSATVFRIEKYGAFVRLPEGVEGLVPISELSFGRIGHPQEVVNLDQVLQVKLIRANEEDGRLKLSFSLKQGGSVVNPWENITETHPVGSVHDGVVEHKEAFGLFVNIASGITGLLPRSAWRDSLEANQFEAKRKGDKVKVRMERIDLDGHKLSFSLPREDEDESWRGHASTTGAATGKSAGFGTMADLLKGIKGK